MSNIERIVLNMERQSEEKYRHDYPVGLSKWLVNWLIC